ncbi:CHAT domain-containing protein [Candidatus Parabeggiatoa sp. HSG14]|uniref:CHAT domain-containing protein n=1 Tax=Candidatus Parabeggiatoa sp. HSG14 TaxID=3055593 RepID=UPI0025A718A3|nr:CHAT domain-containing protein [Thiotrichales bacterium HSG14]
MKNLYNLLFLLNIFSTPVFAQITTDGTLGPKMSLTGPNYLIGADLGQQKGGNLFHSFQDFNLQSFENATEIATFSGPNTVQNIISRVTGGNPSHIDGLIRSTIPNVDMYFLNPYGIIFGPNAALNVSGSFHASTADYLQLEDGGYFSTRYPSDSLLTIAPVETFGFLTENSAPIEIKGSFLSVPSKETLSMIGGDLSIQDSILLASSGQINLVAVASKGEVIPSPSSLAINDFKKLGTINVSQSYVKELGHFANIDVSGINIKNGKIVTDAAGGQIFVRAGQFFLNKGLVFADTFEGQGLGINIIVNNLFLKEGAKITSSNCSPYQNCGNNQSGHIHITANIIQLSGKNNEFKDDLLNTNSISTGTFSSGNSGNIDIDTVTLEINSGLIEATTQNSGNAGDITIDVHQITLQNNGFINTSSAINAIGNAGNITINARERLSVKERSSISAVADKGSMGNAGRVDINTQDLTLKNNAEINAFSYGRGSAGTIDIKAETATLINGGNIITEATIGGGNINLQVNDLSIDRGLILPKAPSPFINPTKEHSFEKAVLPSPYCSKPKSDLSKFSVEVHKILPSPYAAYSDYVTLLEEDWEEIYHALKNTEQQVDSKEKFQKLILLSHFGIEKIRYLKAHQKTSKFIVQLHSSLKTTLNFAEETGDKLLQSYVYGHLGELYKVNKYYEDAQRLIKYALFLAQEINALDVLYRWQWQLGRIFKAKGQRKAAMKQYNAAINTLEQIDYAFQNKESSYLAQPQFFHNAVHPVYFEKVELLLEKNEEKEAIKVVEQFKELELENYLQQECQTIVVDWTKFSELVDKLRKDSLKTAFFYPIILPKRLELLLILPDDIKQIPLIKPSDGIDLENIVKRFMKTPGGLPKLETTFAQRLYQLLIKPIEQHLKGIETLVVVPHGALRALPFAALHDGNQYLVEKYALATIPSLTLTDMNQITRDDIHAFLGGVSEKIQHFSALKHVPNELQAIRKTLGKTEQFSLNQNFTAAIIETHLKTRFYNIVHFATHGKFRDRIEDNFILAYDGELKMTELESIINSSTYYYNPVDLLTLSACETARTGIEFQNERAALGLAGVAVDAGARSALASLWKIADKSTAELMSTFYQQLVNTPNLSKAKALQTAQRKLIKTYPPSHWAAFILIGNWL